MKKLLWMTLPLVLGVALAQPEGLPEPTWNPAEWFGSAAALAAVVAAAVAFLKRNVLTNLTGWLTVGMSFALSILAAIIASFTSVYDAALMEAVTFGASAGLLASGGLDAIRGLLGKARE